MNKIDVVCGALIKNGQVMIAQRNYGSAKGKFEFPGGKVEKGETKEEALIREFKEECEIDLLNVEFLETNIDYQDDNEIHLTCFICTCEKIPTKPIVHSQFIWTTPDHIYAYDFFESDRVLVEKLKLNWENILKKM